MTLSMGVVPCAQQSISDAFLPLRDRLPLQIFPTVPHQFDQHEVARALFLRQIRAPCVSFRSSVTCVNSAGLKPAPPSSRACVVRQGPACGSRPVFTAASIASCAISRYVVHLPPATDIHKIQEQSLFAAAFVASTAVSRYSVHLPPAITTHNTFRNKAPFHRGVTSCPSPSADTSSTCRLQDTHSQKAFSMQLSVSFQNFLPGWRQQGVPCSERKDGAFRTAL